MAPPRQYSRIRAEQANREMEVLSRADEDDKKIAMDLIISESAVTYHLRNILDWLNPENRSPDIGPTRSGLTFDDPMPL